MCVLIESTTKQNYKSMYMYVDKCGFSNISMNKNQAVLTHCGLKQILIKDKKVNFYIIFTEKFCFWSSERKKNNGSRHMPIELGRWGSVEQNQRFCKL